MIRSSHAHRRRRVERIALVALCAASLFAVACTDATQPLSHRNQVRGLTRIANGKTVIVLPKSGSAASPQLLRSEWDTTGRVGGKELLNMSSPHANQLAELNRRLQQATATDFRVAITQAPLGDHVVARLYREGSGGVSTLVIAASAFSADVVSRGREELLYDMVSIPAVSVGRVVELLDNGDSRVGGQVRHWNTYSADPTLPGASEELRAWKNRGDRTSSGLREALNHASTEVFHGMPIAVESFAVLRHSAQ